MPITTKSVAAGRSGATRISILEADGSETVINLTDSIHYFLAFAKVNVEDVKEGAGFPGEVLVGGSVPVLGEMYFQLGEQHPELIAHCVKRSTEKIARKIFEEVKKSGIDPIAEALKKMPPPSEKGGWN
jgi:hypothetical protein